MCLHINRKAYMACNFNCHIEAEGLFKVTGNDVHCKSGNISDTVQDIHTFLLQTNNRKWYMAFQVASFSMTEWPSRSFAYTARCFYCDFSSSCAADDKISSESESRGVLCDSWTFYMAALCNRAGHIFSSCGFFLLSFSPRLISAVADWMSTILPHMMWP